MKLNHSKQTNNCTQVVINNPRMKCLGYFNFRLKSNGHSVDADGQRQIVFMHEQHSITFTECPNKITLDSFSILYFYKSNRVVYGLLTSIRGQCNAFNWYSVQTTWSISYTFKILCKQHLDIIYLFNFISVLTKALRTMVLNQFCSADF